MAQQMMFDPILTNYRGQATNGTVVTVEPAAMELANKRAGRTVYDSDWWVETVQSTLEHWGINGRRWIDAATRVPRLDFTFEKSKSAAASSSQQGDPDAPDESPTNPSTKPLGSGPLTNRIVSGPLNPKDL